MESENSARERQDLTARMRTKRILAAQKRMDVLAEIREKQFQRKKDRDAETGQ